MTTTTPSAPLPPAASAALSAADVAAHEAGSYVRLPAAVVRAVAQYEAAALHAAQLAAKAATGMDLAKLDVRSWEFAEDLMAGCRATLAEAGRLDLIGGAA